MLPALGAGATSPEDTVRATADRALEILADDALSNGQKTERLTVLLDDVSDFETTSKLVLARGWSQFDEAQRKEFQVLLRDYLVARYRSRVDDYAGEKVEILGGRDEARGDYTVHTKISGGGRPQPIVVDYRLRKDDAGTWRVIDVIGEDISVVSNLRSQFQSLLSKGGPQKLIDTLRSKIASGEVERTPEGSL
jgi:phospholipid transport system substrate-binding protein